MMQFYGVRFVILGISTICMMLVSVNSILFNFTIICMENDNLNISAGQHLFSPFQRSALFSGTAIGAIFGGIPINLAIKNYGLRYTITFYGLISAFSTLLAPFAFSLLSFPALFISRILQGSVFSAEYVMNSAVSRNWATLDSIGTFLLFISAHSQLGPIYSMPAAAYFCASPYGWSGIYYAQGILTFIFFAAFFAIFRDNPIQHPFVNEKELKEIEKGKIVEENISTKNIPYKEILSDWAVWILLFAFFSDEIGFQFYTQMGPYYLNKVLGINIVETGLFAALPYAICVLSKLISGPLNDRILSKFLSEHSRIKLFTAISQYGIVGSLVCLAIFPLFTKSLWLILPFYATLNMFTGLNILGVFRCTQTIALKYAEMLITWESIVSSCVALLMPSIVNLIAPNDALGNWAIVLLAIAFIVFILNTAFTFFGKTTPRKWAHEIKCNNVS